MRVQLLHGLSPARVLASRIILQIHLQDRQRTENAGRCQVLSAHLPHGQEFACLTHAVRSGAITEEEIVDLDEFLPVETVTC